MITIHEKFDSREATEGIDSPSVDLLYVVRGTEDDADVRATVESTVPAFYAGLSFQTYHIAHQGAGLECQLALPAVVLLALLADDALDARLLRHGARLTDIFVRPLEHHQVANEAVVGVENDGELIP